MTTRPVTKPKVELVKPQSSGLNVDKPRKFTAVYLNPVCKHVWGKLAKEFQTLEAEGKIVWKCRTCDEITSTYDWQTP